LVTKKPPISLVTSPPSGTVPPSQFGPQGRELWASITSEFDISDAGGVAVLKQVCEATDRIAQLSAQIAVDGPVVYVKGCPKAHPALRDELANRAFVVRGLQKLGVNIEQTKPIGRPPTSSWSG
jgi:hypothetical protein